MKHLQVNAFSALASGDLDATVEFETRYTLKNEPDTDRLAHAP